MDIDIDKLKEMYFSGLSAYQIADELNLNANTVWSYLKKSGIKMRTKKEALQKYKKYRICVVCRKSFCARQDGHGNFYKKTCSSECEKKLRAESSIWTDERKEYMSKLFTGRKVTWHVRRGEECSYWKGGHTSSYYRHLAFEVYGMEKKCEVVGCKNPTDLSYICVHHKDGNRDNNARDNLEIRCKSHHTGYHIEVGDIGWSIHNKKWVPRITLEEIQKELTEGKSIRAICKKYNTSNSTIDKILNENGIKNPRKNPNKNPYKNKVTK